MRCWSAIYSELQRQFVDFLAQPFCGISRATGLSRRRSPRARGANSSMVYPVKMHVRYSTVLVIVVLLMGSVLYEVTRTEAIGRQSAARTQDIALPAPQPVVHTVRASAN